MVSPRVFSKISAHFHSGQLVLEPMNAPIREEFARNTFYQARAGTPKVVILLKRWKRVALKDKTQNIYQSRARCARKMPSMEFPPRGFLDCFLSVDVFHVRLPGVYLLGGESESIGK
jgi:hypothetical protein